MEPERRKHSCKLGIDYSQNWTLVTPEGGTDHVVLTTPIFYVWHRKQLATEEGIRFGPFIEPAGHLGNDLVVKLLKNHKIVFVSCKEIFVYGLILSEYKDAQIYAFDQTSTKIIQGSPFLFRKTVFVSYARADKELVRDLVTRIERHINVWVDEKQIIVGDSIAEKLDSGLSDCDALILCLSQNSVGSSWVRREYAFAMHAGIKILPIRLDDSFPPPTLSDTKYIDFLGNEENCVSEIFISVEQAAKRNRPSY